jgi:hypothetical protein
MANIWVQHPWSCIAGSRYTKETGNCLQAVYKTGWLPASCQCRFKAYRLGTLAAGKYRGGGRGKKLVATCSISGPDSLDDKANGTYSALQKGCFGLR